MSVDILYTERLDGKMSIVFFLALYYFNQSGKYMYICVGGINVASFYNIRSDLRIVQTV